MFQRTIQSRIAQRAAVMVTAATTTTVVMMQLDDTLLLAAAEDQEQAEETNDSNLSYYTTQQLLFSSLRNNAQCDTKSASPPSFFARRLQTLRRMREVETKDATLDTIYKIQSTPIGEGSFGQVFLGKNRQSGESVAIKKIWKEFTNREDCQREMNALLHIRAHGGHPHICSLKENFDEDEHFALILDLINGGELFDRLVDNGAYSELDASRLMREVASAMNFLHGIGIVHGDMKPENLMLSQTHTSAIIKVVDFGCSEFIDQPNQPNLPRERNSTGTVAYASPERANSGTAAPSKALDMWAVGIILYIMLTGMHPLDPQGDAADEQLKEQLLKIQEKNINIIKSGDLQPFTKHLSPSAIDLLSQLLEPDPRRRIRSSQLVENSWIQGITAASGKMENSDKRLSKFRKYRSKIETKVFQNLLSHSDLPSTNAEGSLFQKAFSSLDKEDKGFLTVNDVADEDEHAKIAGPRSTGDVPNDMSLSEFSDLLGEHMVSRYFPSGHVLYREGDIGNHMYFINSGKIEVTTKDGFRASLKHGDTCGEGGLLNLNRMRSATLRTLTPVHVIQIDRESFTKYLSSSDSVLGMKLREKVNARKFGRAEYIIGKHKDMVETKVPMGHVIFSEGDKADGIYMLSAGMVDVETKRGRRVYDVKPGELFGVQSFLMKKQGRRAFAKCVDSSGCTIKALPADVVESLLKSNPGIRESLMDLALRREFRRAVVEKLDRSFPFDRRGLRKAFNAIDLDKTGQLNLNEVRDLLLNHLADSSITEEEVEALLATLDLQQNGVVDFDEFCSIFRK